MTENERQELREELEAYFPPIVTRNFIEKATGGMIKVNSLINYDCQGTGIKNPISTNRKVVYRKKDAIDFIMSRLR